MKLRNSLFRVIGLLLVAVFVSSCVDDDVDYRESTEVEILKSYMNKYYAGEEADANGVYFVEETEGTGTQVAADKYVVVKYTGQIVRGEVFDTNNEDLAIEKGMHSPTRFYDYSIFKVSKDQVVHGFYYGLLKMKEGSKAKMFFPSSLGYGNEGSGTLIPGYSSLIFEVEVIEVVDDYKAFNKSEIEKYLDANNIEAQWDEEFEYYYQVLEDDAEQDLVEEGKMISYNYYKKFLNGQVFSTNIEDLAYENDIWNRIVDYTESEFKKGAASVAMGWEFSTELLHKGSKVVLYLDAEMSSKSGDDPAKKGYLPSIEYLEIVDITED